MKKCKTPSAGYLHFFTSPTGAVAKYCDECVCLSVCLSDMISPEPHARSLPIFVHIACGRGSVLLRQGDKIPREEAVLGVSTH